jgi:hypothetical protein
MNLTVRDINTVSRALRVARTRWKVNNAHRDTDQLVRLIVTFERAAKVEATAKAIGGEP